MIKKSFTFLIYIALCTSTLFANEDSLSTKGDTQKSESLKENKKDPLAGKKFGIEINPFELTDVDNGYRIAAGTSFFNLLSWAEIAVPVLFERLSDEKITQFFLGAHYRHFLNKPRNGLYISGMIENHLIHYKYDKLVSDTSKTTKSEGEINARFGVGLGFGYRYFTPFGLYWGASISVGSYTWKASEFKRERYGEGFLSRKLDTPLLLDIEVFKVGWAF